MRRYNLVIAVLSIAMGGTVFWFSRTLTLYNAQGVPGEAFWPHLIAGLFIGLGLLQIVEVVAVPAVNAGRTVALWSPAVRRGYLGGLLAVIAAVIMTVFGFVPAIVLFIPAVMLVMGERRPLVIGATTVATTGVIWFFFVDVFNITLPTAVFFE